MSKRGSKAVKEFTSAAWSQFGMRVVVLAAYLQDGQATVSLWVEGPILFRSNSSVSNSFDHNKENGGKSFRGSTDDWEDSLTEDFGNWSAECFGKGVFQQV